MLIEDTDTHFVNPETLEHMEINGDLITRDRKLRLVTKLGFLQIVCFTANSQQSNILSGPSPVIFFIQGSIQQL